MDNFFFGKWFRLNEAATIEYQESLLASFLLKRITEALKSFFADNRRESLPHYLSKILTGVVKGDTGEFPVPANIGRTTLSSEFNGWKLVLYPVSNGTFAFAGNEKIGLPYDSNVLKNAQKFDDRSVSMMLDRMDDQLVHECSHISTSKTGEDATIKGKPYWDKFEKGSPEYAEAQIRYYSDPGEVRAHAKQYANIYRKNYGDRFDKNNLEKMSWDLNDNKLYRYVHRLRDSSVQKQFPQLAERMSKAYADFVKTVEYFLNAGSVSF